MSWFSDFISSKREARREPRSARGNTRNYHLELDAKLDLGARAFAFLQEVEGAEFANSYNASIVDEVKGGSMDRGSQPSDRSARTLRLPRDFWVRFVTEAQRLVPCKAKFVSAQRALKTYLASRAGVSTRACMRGGLKPSSKRNSNGATNATKAAGCAISVELYQFFIDQIQRLHLRSDATLLLNHARVLRRRLVQEGVSDNQLPKLEGRAGIQWLFRWRRHYDIAYNELGMRLKCPWRKVLERVRVLMWNIFCLRAFWEICFPGKEMRWFSLDQKPSWVNNAGLTKAYTRKGSNAKVLESHNATRDRYTLGTTVCSWIRNEAHSNVPVENEAHSHVPVEMPKIGILFRGAKGDRAQILKKLKPKFACPDWMMLQTQTHGSYRSEDVCEFLEWALPNASCGEESIIVLLDWFQGHRTVEVEELVKRKGHVLLFHGGGTTPFTQINDTHLHAQVQRFMVHLENQFALEKQLAARRAGRRIVPTPQKDDTCRMVQTMWETIDHERVARKGYRQLGPTMAFDGPVRREDVYNDLRSVMENIDPPEVPGGVGVALRENAKKFVRQGYEQGKWRTWSDVHLFIEEHSTVDHSPDQEGVEAFAPEIEDSDGVAEDEEGAESLEESEDGVDVGSQPDPTDGGSQTAPADEPQHAISLVSDDELVESPSPRPPHEVDAALDEARLLLIDHHRRTGNASMMNRLYQELSKSQRKQKWDAAESTQLLKRRASEIETAEKKRRKADETRKRLEANEALTQQERTALAQASLIQIRAAETEKKRIEDMQRIRLRKTKADYDLWLQTVFPTDTATKLIDRWNRADHDKRILMENVMKTALSEDRFKKKGIAPMHLWDEDLSLTKQWAQVRDPWSTKTQLHWVRCSPNFRVSVIERCCPSKLKEGPDACLVLHTIFEMCGLPHNRRALDGRASWNALRILDHNGYIMEKAFIWGIRAFSIWLKSAQFPGIYTWPPSNPEIAQPGSLSEVPQTGADVVDAQLPPQLRVGRGPASSGGP